MRYLLRNGLAGAATWKAHFGIGSEVTCSAEKQAELDRALAQLPVLRAAPPEAGFAAQIAGLEAFVAEATAGLAAAALGEGIEPDPHCHAKLAQLLSRHSRLAEEEAVATKAKLEAIVEQVAALQADLANTKRDALAKAAANANLQRMLRQRLAETAEPDVFTAALKAGSDPPTLQRAAARHVTREWLALHHLDHVPEQAILALIALSGRIHVDAAAEVARAAAVQPLWATFAGNRCADDAESDLLL